VGVIVLDASLLIAVMDEQDPLHDAATAALAAVEDTDIRLPASAYAECLVGPARHGRVEDAVSRLRDFIGAVEPATEDIGRRAAEIRAGSRAISLGDALVLATAEILNADAVLTADRAWRGILPTVQVVEAISAPMPDPDAAKEQLGPTGDGDASV
jgi:predicted nucleic acid-binding protein